MSTTEPFFALRQLQEKCIEKNKDLHMVFVDLEKAFDRISDLVVFEKESSARSVC